MILACKYIWNINDDNAIHNIFIRWGVQTEDTLDVKKAMEILDEDHYGMKDVKDRIIEFIAVSKLRLVFKFDASI